MKPKLIDYQTAIYYGSGYANAMRELAKRYKDEDKEMYKCAMSAAYLMELAAKIAVRRIPEDRRAATIQQSRQKYIDLRTRGAGYEAGRGMNERVVSVDDLNSMFDSDPLVCVMCNKTDKEKKRCLRYKLAHKYDFDIPCTLEDGM